MFQVRYDMSERVANGSENVDISEKVGNFSGQIGAREAQNSHAPLKGGEQ
jgi:hypothetical protein